MPAGAKPGERRGGRAKGTLNKSTPALRELAQPYTPEAVAVIARIMRNGDSHQVRLAAARELIDRAYGKAPIAVTGADGAPLVPMSIAFVIAQAVGAENQAIEATCQELSTEPETLRIMAPGHRVESTGTVSVTP